MSSAHLERHWLKESGVNSLTSPPVRMQPAALQGGHTHLLYWTPAPPPPHPQAWQPRHVICTSVCIVSTFGNDGAYHLRALDAEGSSGQDSLLQPNPVVTFDW